MRRERIRFMRYGVILLTLVCLPGTFRPVYSQNPSQAPTRYIVPDSVALRERAGGELVGTLKRGTPVLELETKGDWVHIAAEAWVRRSELAARTSTIRTPSQGEPLIVAEFALNTVEKDRKEDENKIVLKLLVKNSLPQDVSTWSAILVVEDPQGKTLVRTPLEGGPIQSGAVQDFNFFWAESEDAFGSLARYAADSNRINVHLKNVKYK